MLGPASRLRLPANGGLRVGSTRDVYLEGDAYLEVKHDAARPFPVHTAAGVVEHIGTEFLVSAYPDAPGMRVVLARGMVALYRPPTAGADRPPLLVAVAPQALAQEAAETAVTRGPRFLLAAAPGPQPVDISRTPILRERLTLDLNDVPLKAALATISTLSGLQLVYSDDALPVGTRLRLRADGLTVAAALRDVLIDAEVDVVFSQTGRAALVPRVGRALLQNGRVGGRVTDGRTGQTIAGASVALEGTPWHATSDENGQYRIANVVPGRYTISASRIGYAKVSQSVTVASGQDATLDLVLRVAPTLLDQVVVTATKTETRIQDVPAAVEVVDAAALAASGAKTVLEALRSVTGVTDASYGENFQSIQLRGLPRKGNENETVLLLIDGVPQTDSRNSACLTTMPIDNVDEIEVVKGPNSALYGRTAIGGVINFITRDPPSHS